MTTILLAHGGGSGGTSLASWRPLIALLVVYAGIVVALTVFGRHGDHPWRLGRFLLRIPHGLERFTGIPGWAAATVGTALFGLLVAGMGFYTDVAWHVALGRDEELFTAPHAAIVLGLLLIAGAAMIGVLFATLQRVPTGARIGPVRVPWSVVPLGILGFSALMGFPLDEVWHGIYGIDVTMWSPTHMLMILGAALSPLAAWLVLAEAGVSARGAWGRGVHAVTAWLVLQGLAAPMGEFVFGVPQFQQLFHPLLTILAGGFALVVVRLVLGRGWALGIAVFTFVFDLGGIPGMPDSPVNMRAGGFYLVSAAAVEAAGWLFGTDRRLRFAIASGLGVGTLGMAGEFWWNAGAHQPWTTALLPDAAILGLVAAVAVAVLGAAYGGSVALRGAGIRPAAIAVAVLVAVAAILWPMPRRVGDVHADLRLTEAAPGEVTVHVTLDPPDAAADARWFQVIAWQGGDLHVAELRPLGDGRYVATGPMPVTGSSKTLVRLQRGAELMAAPVYLPADPEIDAPEIPAVDRSVAFAGEQRFLLRETRPGPPAFSIAVHGLLALASLAWVLSLAWAASRVYADETVSVAVPAGTVTSRP